MTRRKLWRIAGEVRSQHGRQWREWNTRTVVLAADDFDDAVNHAKAALAHNWSTNPTEARVTSVAPVRANRGLHEDDHETVVIPDATERQ